jgi:pSer/pThr/pTyr-binding forkhead associated (FHA) protein
MIPIESWLDKLESRLQALVEGTADRLSRKHTADGQPNESDIPGSTAPVEVDSPLPGASHSLPQGAFLVVDGVRMFPLDRPVISIGRAPENDLVIADQRVSRQHVQLRAVAGRFVVFDLDSTGGTSLNGQPVGQHVLNPGDVISLAGVPLVFGQEGLTGPDLTQEMKVE